MTARSAVHPHRTVRSHVGDLVAVALDKTAAALGVARHNLTVHTPLLLHDRTRLQTCEDIAATSESRLHYDGMHADRLDKPRQVANVEVAKVFV